MDNGKIIWDKLIAEGFTKAGAAGLMGNLKAESNLDPKNLQNTFESKLGYTDNSYTQAVDNGSYKNFIKDSAGYGLAQWTYWTRKQNLLNFAKQRRVSIGDLEMQIDFLLKELRESYSSLYKTLKTVFSVSTASNEVLTKFERPRDMSNKVKILRASYGQQIYNKYVNEVVDKTSVTNNNSFLVRVVDDELNVRADAGTEFKITTVIKKGEIYTIVSTKISSDGGTWGKLKSGVGWINIGEKFCKRI